MTPLLNQAGVYYQNYTSLEAEAKALSQKKMFYFIILKSFPIIYLGQSFIYY